MIDYRTQKVAEMHRQEMEREAQAYRLAQVAQQGAPQTERTHWRSTIKQVLASWKPALTSGAVSEKTKTTEIPVLGLQG